MGAGTPGTPENPERVARESPAPPDSRGKSSWHQVGLECGRCFGRVLAWGS